MITVMYVGYARGYSGRDHLLCDSELHGIVGEEFSSVACARKAANALASSSSPILIEVLFANGETRKFGP